MGARSGRAAEERSHVAWPLHARGAQGTGDAAPEQLGQVVAVTYTCAPQLSVGRVEFPEPFLHQSKLPAILELAHTIC
eukprot:2889187-Pleurochrysis_carterae.AAC.1